jgi:hypothetical protein
MQLVLDIDEQQKDTVLNIIRNLKEGLVKRYTIRTHHPQMTVAAVTPDEEDEIQALLENMREDERSISSVSHYKIDF